MELSNFNSNSYSSLSPEVQEAMKGAVTTYADARPDGFGRDYRVQAAIEESRNMVADKLGVSADEIFFNHGSLNSEIELISWLLQLFNVKFVITSRFENAPKLEYLKILETTGKIELHYLETSEYGEIQTGELQDFLKKNGEKAIVSLSHANFFTGVLLPVKTILQICRENNSFFHLNAGLTIGRYQIDFEKLKPDFVTFDTALLNGPNGIGCTFVSKAIVMTNKHYNYLKKTVVMHENRNIPQILGFRVALFSAMENMKQSQQKIETLREELIRKLNAELGLETIDNQLTKSGLYNHVAFWASHADFGKYLYEKLDLNGILVANLPFPTDIELGTTGTFVNIGLSRNLSSLEIDRFVEVLKMLKN